MDFEKIHRLIIVILLTAFLVSGCSLAPELPQPNMLEGSKIYDQKGNLVSTLYREKRTTVPLSEVAEIAQKAILAVEDSRFYKHHGVSPTGIIRAAWKNLWAGEVVAGGSTITQQTAKNLFLSNERTFTRKFIELWYALQLENKYSKDEILEMYLNQIYFGEGAYGIEEAAQTYFGKSAKDLNLPESAMLAGLLKAPSNYSPYVNWEAAKKRQQVALARMVETAVITEKDAKEAANYKIQLNSVRKSSGKAPYFINEIIKYVSENYEDGANLLLTGGLKVETTLDLDMQEAAERAFAKRLKDKDAELQGALVALDPQTGYVLAMVGGRDYASSQFNRALHAKRQPGSAFKPFVYTAAIEQGYTAGTTIRCEEVEFHTEGETYKPRDYGSTPYHDKPFTLKEALQVSDNVVAVRLAEQVGPQNLIAYAKKMGIESQLRPYLSLALGSSEVNPLEMAVAYSTLANRGFRVKPMFITKITDSKGNVLEENSPVKEPAIDPKTAYIITDMLSSVVQPGGTASIVSSILARPSAGKTGTTQDYADAWFVGYTPELVGAVYIGYDTNRKSVGSTGGQLAAPLWADFAAESLINRPAKEFPVPAGLVKRTICADSGLLATPYSEKVLEAYFVKGTEPTEHCPLHSKWLNQSPIGNQFGEPDSQENQHEQGEGQQNFWDSFPRGGRRFFDWLR